MAEACTYASHQGSTDNSNVDNLGWENAEENLENDVIWRIPVFSVVATFSERSDSRSFAESIALRYANGVSVKESKEVAIGLAKEEEIEMLKGE
jgi:hypothetical protein